MTTANDVIKVLGQISDIDELNRVSAFLKEQYNMAQRLAQAQFRPGQAVKFTDRRGDTVVGTIEKLMPKNIKVREEQDSGIPKIWTVSPSLLSAA